MKKTQTTKRSPSLVLHQYWQNDIYWSIASRFAKMPTMVKKRIRFFNAIPRKKEYIRELVEAHRFIVGDKRKESEIIVSLFMPAKKDFDFLKEYKESREV